MFKKFGITRPATPTHVAVPQRLDRRAHSATLPRQILRDLVAEMID